MSNIELIGIIPLVTSDQMCFKQHLSESAFWPTAIYKDFSDHCIKITGLIPDIHISLAFYKVKQFYANKFVASSCCHKKKFWFSWNIKVGDVLIIRSYSLLFHWNLPMKWLYRDFKGSLNTITQLYSCRKSGRRRFLPFCMSYSS